MEVVLAHCQAELSQHGNLLVIFFMGGLAGSLTHCLAMCGPVVACQAACGGGCSGRMSMISQWQYHSGRLVAYGLLGSFASLLSRPLVATGYWPIISAAIVVLAGVVFLLSALFPKRHVLFDYTPKNSFMRGVMMSFMPCGLLYAALMLASTITNPLVGMLAMWLFVLGTTPALLVVSGGASLLAIKWQEVVRGIGRFGMAFNGLALLVMAAKTMR